MKYFSFKKITQINFKNDIIRFIKIVDSKLHGRKRFTT